MLYSDHPRVHYEKAQLACTAFLRSKITPRMVSGNTSDATRLRITLPTATARALPRTA